MDAVLGIDQGGTKTHAAVFSTAGQPLGFGSSGGSYHSIRGMDHAMERVREAADAACLQSGIRKKDIKAVRAGMTGADFADEIEDLTKSLTEQFPGSGVQVVNDCIVAFHAGSELKYGAVICAGTGLNCAVLTPDGRQFIWGEYISPWKGCDLLYNKVMEVVFEAETSLRPPTDLTGIILKYFSVADVDTLLYDWIKKRLSAQRFSRLPILVDYHAARGEGTCRSLLADFGISCARYAVAGLRRLDMLDIPIEVVLSGSVFKSCSSLLKDTVSEQIRAEAPRAVVVEARYEPVVGGALLALEDAGFTRGATEFRRNIDNSPLHGVLMRALRLDEKKAKKLLEIEE